MRSPGRSASASALRAGAPARAGISRASRSSRRENVARLVRSPNTLSRAHHRSAPFSGQETCVGSLARSARETPARARAGSERAPADADRQVRPQVAPVRTRGSPAGADLKDAAQAPSKPRRVHAGLHARFRSGWSEIGIARFSAATQSGGTRCGFPRPERKAATRSVVDFRGGRGRQSLAKRRVAHAGVPAAAPAETTEARRPRGCAPDDPDATRRPAARSETAPAA